MSDEESIEAVSKISRNAGSKKIVDMSQLNEIRVPPNKEKFDASMQTQMDPAVAQVKKPEVSETSLIEEMRALNRKVDGVGNIEPQQLADQSKNVIAQLEDIKARLSDPQVEIKDDYKRILKNKLEHIDGNLKIALEKAGVEYVPPEVMLNLENNTPVKRFLGLLTDGQDKLKALGGELQVFADTDKHINPASLLMIQIKVNYIQQEIEFFTSLLNKALESTKTIMNVQV